VGCRAALTPCIRWQHSVKRERRACKLGSMVLGSWAKSGAATQQAQGAQEKQSTGEKERRSTRQVGAVSAGLLAHVSILHGSTIYHIPYTRPPLTGLPITWPPTTGPLLTGPGHASLSHQVRHRTRPGPLSRHGSVKSPVQVRASTQNLGCMHGWACVYVCACICVDMCTWECVHVGVFVWQGGRKEGRNRWKATAYCPQQSPAVLLRGSTRWCRQMLVALLCCCIPACNRGPVALLHTTLCAAWPITQKLRSAAQDPSLPGPPAQPSHLCTA